MGGECLGVMHSLLDSLKTFLAQVMFLVFYISQSTLGTWIADWLVGWIETFQGFVAGHLSRQGKEEGAEMYRLSCLRALRYFPGDMPVSRLNTVIK